MATSNTYIVGGGVIGLALALQLRLQGRAVVVLERDSCGDASNGSASVASAGMLGVHDPKHPPELRRLAEFSYHQYPEFLKCIEEYSGIAVPLRTQHVLEAVAAGDVITGDALTTADLRGLEPELVAGNVGWCRREEPSLDPRLLIKALAAACRGAGVEIREHEAMLSADPAMAGSYVITTAATYGADLLVYSAGAWTAELTRNAVPTEPRRGQMLCLATPGNPLRHTVRGQHCYLVPRAEGHVVVGSTVERTGFDTATDAATIDRLHAAAAQLLPSLAKSERVQAWAGLRPGTPDDLPILGALRQGGAFPSMPRVFAATGHFRNGILLAPGTAHVMAQILRGDSPSVPLQAFSPARF